MGTFFARKLGYQWQNRFGCAYVWPPIGGYFTHKSTTCSTASQGRILEIHCEQRWRQAGTRKENDDQTHRWIAGFTPTGPANWLGEAIHLPRDLVKLRWLTQAPPGTLKEQLGWRYFHEGISPANKPEGEDKRKGEMREREGEIRNRSSHSAVLLLQLLLEVCLQGR